MLNLQQDLARASSVARLDRLITALGSDGPAFRWEAGESEWLLAFLTPFAQHDATTAMRLSAGAETSPLDGASVLEAFLVSHLDSDPAAITAEIEGFAKLYSRLYTHESLDQSDVARAISVASLARSLLLSDVPTAPAHTLSGSAELRSPLA